MNDIKQMINESKEKAEANQLLAPQQNEHARLIEFVQSKAANIQEYYLGDMVFEKYFAAIMAALKKNPAIAQCTLASVVECVRQAASVGLIPNNKFGHAWLIPRKNKQKILELNFDIGYQGWLKLVYDTGLVRYVTAQWVYEADEFITTYGTHAELIHRPNWSGDRGSQTHVYAYAELLNGAVLFDVRTKKYIDDYCRDTPAWRDNYDAMALKYPVARLCRFMPKAEYIANALLIESPEDAEFEEAEVEESKLITESN